jgi:Domain of unknown function (DUF5753)
MPSYEPPETLAERVANRMERQAILLRENPPTALFVLDESVLLRPFGGPKVMAEQLDKLAGFAKSEEMQIRILPYSSATYAGTDGMFTVLTFSDDPAVVYSEAPEIGQVVEAKDIVDRCAVRFDLVMGEALPRAESTRMIIKAREAYR